MAEADLGPLINIKHSSTVSHKIHFEADLEGNFEMCKDISCVKTTFFNCLSRKLERSSYFSNWGCNRIEYEY